jgi:hypothetical protein
VSFTHVANPYHSTQMPTAIDKPKTLMNELMGFFIKLRDEVLK